jgi:hypothetical protein
LSRQRRREVEGPQVGLTSARGLGCLAAGDIAVFA